MLAWQAVLKTQVIGGDVGGVGVAGEAGGSGGTGSRGATLGGSPLTPDKRRGLCCEAENGDDACEAGACRGTSPPALPTRLRTRSSICCRSKTPELRHARGWLGARVRGGAEGPSKTHSAQLCGVVSARPARAHTSVHCDKKGTQLSEIEHALKVPIIKDQGATCFVSLYLSVRQAERTHDARSTLHLDSQH